MFGHSELPCEKMTSKKMIVNFHPCNQNYSDSVFLKLKKRKKAERRKLVLLMYEVIVCLGAALTQLAVITSYGRWTSLNK